MLYFGLFMVLFYLVIGFLLIFAPVFTYIIKEPRVIFGIFFVLYGIFRFVRLYPKLKSLNQINEQDEKND
jgi:prolipoprotein diacylglyceryltransferase